MQTPELDSHELAIIRELQANARLSVQELADRIGLSASPTWRRVRALEERGVIRGYTAVLDARKLGHTQYVLAQVTLERHDFSAIDEFEAQIRNCPEVLEFIAMTGDCDYLLGVMVRDTVEYEAFLRRAIFSCRMVRNVRSNFALRQIKFAPSMVLT